MQRVPAISAFLISASGNRVEMARVVGPVFMKPNGNAFGSDNDLPVCFLHVTGSNRSLPPPRAVNSRDAVSNSLFQVILFELDPTFEGEHVSMRLVDILSSADGSGTHEWPRDPVVITTYRATDGVVQGGDQHAVLHAQHALSDIYIRGNEKITIFCKFNSSSSHRAPHLMVTVQFQLVGRRAESDVEYARLHALHRHPPPDSRNRAAGASRQQSRSITVSGGSGGCASLASVSGGRPDDEEMQALLAAQEVSRSEIMQHAGLVLPIHKNYDSAPQECVSCAATVKKSACIICEDRPRKIVFVPCGHYVCCATCAAHPALKNLCPVCRVYIEKKVVVFGPD